MNSFRVKDLVEDCFVSENLDEIVEFNWYITGPNKGLCWPEIGLDSEDRYEIVWEE